MAPRFALVTAEASHVRARALRLLAAALEAAGLRVGGFVQERAEVEGRRGIALTRLGAGTRVTLAVDGVAPRDASEIGYCTFAFRSDTFAAARRWVQEDEGRADVLVVDGLGKMEAAGDGHAACLRLALARPSAGPVVLGVRASQLFGVLERFQLAPEGAPALELPAPDAAIRELAARLARPARLPG